MTNNNKCFTIFIMGYAKLQNHLVKTKNEDSDVKTIDDLIEMSHNDNFKFVIFDLASQFEEFIEEDIFNYIDRDTGLWIGNGFENQELIESPDKYNNDEKQGNDIVVMVNNGKIEYIKSFK